MALKLKMSPVGQSIKRIGNTLQTKQIFEIFKVILVTKKGLCNNFNSSNRLSVAAFQMFVHNDHDYLINDSLQGI